MAGDPAFINHQDSQTSGDMLVPGRNCWRVEGAERFAVLVDGEDYFAAVRAAMIAARRRIDIAAWDIHSRVALVRGAGQPDDGLPVQLGELLIALLERNPDLSVHILLWDYAPIYALEREPLLFGDGPWERHPRLRFIKDSSHPLAASQHQKLVVIDDRVAFCGGFDLSKWRWDTSAHAADDPRRRDPDGDPYPPFHDLGAVVDGDVARALAELFAERWRWAGGEHRALPPADSSAQDVEDPWPAGVEPQLFEQPVAIARTLPKYDGRPAVRESERLYLDMIARAGSLLYIENQYLTSRAIRNALSRSLARAQGPDIVIVLPRQTGHWLEQHTMDVLRARLLSRLRDADRHGRLRVYYPDVGGDRDMMVHAKLMIADDRVLRLGSSNLSNRSMGLDSECDLCIVAESDDQRAYIAGLRRRLLGMFLSREPNVVADAEARAARWGRSPGAAVDTLREGRGGDGGARLEVLDGRADPEWERQLPDERLIDPDRPLGPDLVADVVVGDQESAGHLRRRLWIGGGILVLFLALAAAWRWTPLASWLDPEVLAAAARDLAGTTWGPPVALVAFVAAAVVAVPVTLLILVCSLVFDPITGALLALTGSTLAAAAGYAIGRFAGRGALDSLAGGRLERLSRRLARRGILTIVTVRIVPVAPFAVINLAAGASHVRLRDVVIGTVIGMAPAVIAMGLFAEGLLSLLGRADVRSIALVGLGLAAMVGLTVLGRRLLRGEGD
jgi:phosphatidylserine/phosphatidylglycerophosphate/cardiolipin synthase-like enzyme/uncharacterized membrane protein YdjX (TVP38/TMEM64 family)